MEKKNIHDVEILKYHPAAFIANAEMGELYKEMVKRFGEHEKGCNSFMATMFYHLGRIHGIREERARRKKQDVHVK